MSKYNDMREHYEKRIEQLQKDERFWRDRKLEDAYEIALNKGKIETYEKILSKLLDEKSDATDSLFMFEGNLYRATSFSLDREEHRPDNLTVEFVRVYPDNTTKE